MNILIVDDEKAIQLLLKDFISEMEGAYNVILASNGKEALDIFIKEKIEIIIADVKMPVMDGLELLKKVKEIDDFVEVIVISGVSELSMDIEALKNNAIDFLLKPIYLEGLEVAVVRAEKQIEFKSKLKEKIKYLEELVDKKTRELIESEKIAAIGRLEQGLFHNISTPISSINVLSQYILSSLKSKLTEMPKQKIFLEELIEKVANINRACVSTTKIIKNFMLKSRNEQQLDMEKNSLAELLKTEMQFLDANISFKHNVEKVIKIDETVPDVNIIYSDFSQTFYNLVNNALDAMENVDKKVLTVELAHDDNNIYIKVGDTGVGISEDIKDKIFDPFFTTKSKKDIDKNELVGTGLGLSECYKMMKPYNARIDIRNNKDKGVTVSIVLPKKGNAA